MKAYGRPIDLKFDFVQFFRKTRVRFWPCSAEHPVTKTIRYDTIQFIILSNRYDTILYEYDPNLGQHTVEINKSAPVADILQ